MAINVILADDHAIMRQGLRVLLEKQPGMEVIGEANSGSSVITLAKELMPDIVVMDVNMPEMDGIAATAEIKQNISGIKVVALSMYSKKRFVTEMLKAGASGYILKEYAVGELVAAIEAVTAGEIYLCAKTTSVVVGDFINGGMENKGTTDPRLTPRQQEIIKRLADGQSSKEIAYSMSVSVKTVDALRRKILKKLNIESLAQLVKYAIREGISSLDN